MRAVRGSIKRYEMNSASDMLIRDVLMERREVRKRARGDFFFFHHLDHLDSCQSGD